jgi:ABC-type multidrug transport system ATPase subunit
LKVLQSEQVGEYYEGLRIVGISKTYRVAGKCCGKKRINALKNTYIDVPHGELFTILGHNGAGKTTLINIITGNISQTSGTAKVNNLDLLRDTKAVEELVGLCPQHDILWEELTASEHIELYAYLRNYKKSEVQRLVDSKLKEVNLTLQANSEVRTYSGGMKRRLSILLSTIGSPKVIFLDEPTTGLDPVNKRFIWTMIQNIKKDKSVILTTHSMEEADFLSDRVGVIVEGNFRCIGTPLELKTTYGSGYLLTFGKYKLTL